MQTNNSDTNYQTRPRSWSPASNCSGQWWWQYQPC